MDWVVYLLECADGAYYCGITCDLGRRLAQHNGQLAGGARFTRGRRPVRLAAWMRGASKSEALKLEMAVKKLPKSKKTLFFANAGH